MADATSNTTLNRLCSIVLGRPLTSLDLPRIALLLAYVPLLIGPPIAALVIVALKAAQGSARLGDQQWRAPIIVAFLNIVLSLIVWGYIVREFGDVFGSVLQDARSLVIPAPAEHTKAFSI